MRSWRIRSALDGPDTEEDAGARPLFRIASTDSAVMRRCCPGVLKPASSPRWYIAFTVGIDTPSLWEASATEYDSEAICSTPQKIGKKHQELTRKVTPILRKP